MFFNLQSNFKQIVFCPFLFRQHGGDGDGVGGIQAVEHGLESVRDGGEAVREVLPDSEVGQPDLAGHPGGGGHGHALLQQRLRQRLQGLAVQQAWKILDSLDDVYPPLKLTNQAKNETIGCTVPVLSTKQP